MLACAKKMKISGHTGRSGALDRCQESPEPDGFIFTDETLGIIGCGAIGRMVARKAKVFGLNIIGYDPYIMHPWLAKENGIQLVSFEEVLKADYLTLHPDLNETSFHMMNDKAFAQMKPSAYVINTSRGKVIDEVALVKALESKKIAGAGLDVFETEPLPKDSPLTKMDNVIMLSHSASYSTYAFSIAPVSIAKEAGRILSGKWPLNPVNKEVTPRVKLVK